MTRLWFKDKTYMDVPNDQAPHYETQPDWDYSQVFEDLPPIRVENGKYVDDAHSDE